MSTPRDSLPAPAAKKRVVVVGGGFGGLQVVKGLKDADVSVTLIDRSNHHLFQPLLYQVSTALLAAGDIAPPLRTVLARQENVSVVLGDADDIGDDGTTVGYTTLDGQRHTIGCDYLVIAAGSRPNYFGNDAWAQHAPPMKTISDAITIRERLLQAFELAAAANDAATRRRHLTFVVVGAGPTGVELAGQIATLGRRTMAREFRQLDLDDMRIIMADGGTKVLGPFAASLQVHARQALTDMGVDVRLGCLATSVDADGITLSTPETDGSGGHADVRIETSTVLWAAGVQPVDLASIVSDATGARLDDTGRIIVGQQCSVPSLPHLFAIGDIANVHGLPGLAEPAIQAGRYVAATIRGQLDGRPEPGPFQYRDLGTMATISPTDAVTQIGPLKLTGIPSKIAWALVHLTFLVGWGNRAAVLASWARVALFGSRRRQVLLHDLTGLHDSARTPPLDT